MNVYSLIPLPRLHLLHPQHLRNHVVLFKGIVIDDFPPGHCTMVDMCVAQFKMKFPKLTAVFAGGI